jgi:hypothetical protein
MKKVLASIITLIMIALLVGCGDDGITVNPTPSNTDVISINGSVVDQNSNKIPNAQILGRIYPSQEYTIDLITDFMGDYEIKSLLPGTYEISVWPTANQAVLPDDPPVATYLIKVTAGKTTYQILRYNYFFDPNPSDTAGNISGRAFENASTAAGAYVLGYRIYNNQKINGNQSNFFQCTTGSQGEYDLKGIPEGLVQIDIWKDEADHELNYDTPKASYQVYVYAGMTLRQDLQFGNM